MPSRTPLTDAEVEHLRKMVGFKPEWVLPKGAHEPKDTPPIEVKPVLQRKAS